MNEIEKGTVAYLTARVAALESQNQTLREALEGALNLLNHMGDVLNGMGAVSMEDVEMATPGFKKIRAALAATEPKS